MGTLKLNEKEANINIDEIANGVYFLKINSQNKTGIYKFVKG